MAPPRLTHFLITGASSGLGSALAICLAARHHPLTLMGRNGEVLRRVADVCRRLGAPVEVLCCDVRDEKSMEQGLLSADDRLIVDVVIANAGIGGAAVLASVQGEAADLAREVIDVNLGGTINTVTPLMDRFVARRSGRFVVVSSMAAFEGLADAPAYAASKAAVRIYGHGLRRLLAPHGVDVNVVTPGFVETPMSASLPFKNPFEWSAKRAAERIVAGIERNEAEIAFPWQLRLGIAVAGCLPVSIVDRVLLHARSRLEPRS